MLSDSELRISVDDFLRITSELAADEAKKLADCDDVIEMRDIDGVILFWLKDIIDDTKQRMKQILSQRYIVK